MCGISLLWRRDAEPAELHAAVTRMNAVQAARGPDAQGAWVAAPFALGHTRLRVLDPSARSDQPFGVGDDRLVYSGEIYNWRALRDELCASGVRFVTDGDTEVLYHALLCWGPKALERIHGMFAFALCRAGRGEVLVARDRLGIKPLHWATVGDGLVVASEIKAMVASGVVAPELDPAGVLQAFRHNHTLGETTAVRRVRSLPPGTWMRWLPPESPRPRRYWRPQFQTSERGSFRDRVVDLDARFSRAVRSHMQADVPVGCYLSGGIDSAAIAVETARAGGDRVTPWSLVFPGAPSSEEHFVDEVSASTGVPSRKVSMRAASLDEYADFIAAAEMPQWWTSDLALKRLAAEVSRAGGRVVLAGEGPDEFLAGYDAYRGAKLRRLAQAFGLERLLSFGAARRASLSASMPWLDLDLASLRFYFERNARSRRAELEEAYGFYPENVAMWDALVACAPETLTPSARAALASSMEEERAWFRAEIAPAVEGASVLAANLYFEVAVRLPSWVLHMGDRVSAAHGLELRLPYLDDEVVEAMLRLPDGDRLRGLREKHILKEVHRGRVPERVRKRRKQPLHTPIRAWVAGFCGEEGFARYWSPERFAAVGLFEFAACDQLRRRVVEGRARDGLDEMITDWAFLMALSTHVLHARLEEVRRVS